MRAEKTSDFWQHRTRRKRSPLFLTLFTCPIAMGIGHSLDEGGATKPELVPQLFEHHAAALSLVRPSAPTTQQEWVTFQEKLRARHAKALGTPVEHTPSPVEFRTVSTLEREGYTLKKILFESYPSVPIPAHLYLPHDLSGPAPGVLCVHGHWPEAKNAPAVHTRSVFLARRGFVVLALDAIGAGERAYEGITYHGRQLGYQILPTGMTLAGLQILDNRRAIDLLASLPEVNPEAIGVTGASGGGNQTFHLAILDPRVKAAGPVCFFGAFAGYFRGAHCACELAPGVLRYAEEGLLAGLVAPRALMILAAKEDTGAAFRIEDARRNAAVAKRCFEAAGAGDQFEFVEFDGGHDYNQAMRERMVAFFEKHLMGKDSGETVPEPTLDLLQPQDLQVLEDGKLPEGALFVPQIAANAASKAISDFEASGQRWSDLQDRDLLKRRLVEEVFGGFPVDSPSKVVSSIEPTGGQEPPTSHQVILSTEPGVEIPLWIVPSQSHGTSDQTIIVAVGMNPDELDLPNDFTSTRCYFWPRGTGPTSWPAANAVDCEDYLLAQGSAVLGRPMLGQWVWDTLRVAAHLRKENPGVRIAFFGKGVMGLVAILAGVLDEDCAGVGAVDFQASYQWSDRFDNRWGLVHFVPGLLRCGDIANIASGLMSRPFVVASPRDGGGYPLAGEKLEDFEDRLLRGATRTDWEDLVIGRYPSTREALTVLGPLLQED